MPTSASVADTEFRIAAVLDPSDSVDEQIHKCNVRGTRFSHRPVFTDTQFHALRQQHEEAQRARMALAQVAPDDHEDISGAVRVQPKDLSNHGAGSRHVQPNLLSPKGDSGTCTSQPTESPSASDDSGRGGGERVEERFRDTDGGGLAVRAPGV